MHEYHREPHVHVCVCRCATRARARVVATRRSPAFQWSGACVPTRGLKWWRGTRGVTRTHNWPQETDLLCLRSARVDVPLSLSDCCSFYSSVFHPLSFSTLNTSSRWRSSRIYDFVFSSFLFLFPTFNWLLSSSFSCGPAEDDDDKWFQTSIQLAHTPSFLIGYSTYSYYDFNNAPEILLLIAALPGCCVTRRGIIYRS